MRDARIEKCPRCKSPRQTYHLYKDGVAVECTYCGLTGEKMHNSWEADEAWNKMAKGWKES